MVMFKKGQLVRTRHHGKGVIKHVSQRVADRYLLTNPYWDFDMYFQGREIVELIGNNFKFKGAK